MNEGTLHISDPITDGLILERCADGDIAINCPLYVVHHSPSGWEWGYNGSGPADLALNVVQHLLVSSGYAGAVTRQKDWYKRPEQPIYRLAARLYQDFKTKFIVAVPQEGGVIRYADMIEWINLQRSIIEEE